MDDGNTAVVLAVDVIVVYVNWDIKILRRPVDAMPVRRVSTMVVAFTYGRSIPNRAAVVAVWTNRDRVDNGIATIVKTVASRRFTVLVRSSWITALVQGGAIIVEMRTSSITVVIRGMTVRMKVVIQEIHVRLGSWYL